MKINLEIDLSLSPRVKNAIRWVVVPAAVLVGSITVAHAWTNPASTAWITPGGKVSFLGLTTLVKEINDRLDALETPVTPCQVRVRNMISRGSTFVSIPRFATPADEDNCAAAITYSDDPGLGATFTVTRDGIYAISFGSGTGGGFSGSITLTLAAGATAAELGGSAPGIILSSKALLARVVIPNSNGERLLPEVSWTGFLAANTVVHPLTDNSATYASPETFFSISRLR